MASKLSLRHIETIHAVILTGSVTGAASRLFVTQPAISNMLREAEDRLGYPLFDRRGGRLMPTPLADMLFEEIERSFTGLEAINDFCEQLRLSQRQRVCVACTPTFGAIVLPLIVKEYVKTTSPVFFSVHSRDANHVAALVSSRKADVGFALRVPDIPGVESVVLGELELYCYLPVGHPLVAHAFLTAEQLRNEPMISLSRIEGVEDLVTRVFAGTTGPPPLAVAECPAAITACAMVAAGIGFTLFDLLPRTLFDASRVAVRPFKPESRLTYQAYWLKSGTRNFDHAPLVQLARQVLADVVTQLKRDNP
ncbi:MAG: LysR substrate-binding domain-containing protein [Polaromonas sp.]